MNHEQARRSQDAARSTPSPRVLLFDAEGEDRTISPDALDAAKLTPHELAWIDIVADDADGMRTQLRAFGLQSLPIELLLDARRAPVFSQQDWFGTRALAPDWRANELDCRAVPWLLLVGTNIVVTLHRDPVPFLEQVAALEEQDSRIGKLGADSFAAVLLDRMLTGYLDAVDAFEARLDKLEVEILKPRVRTTHVSELRRMRHVVANLRRLLSSHRDLFDAVARPDFQPDQEEKVQAQFHALGRRYDRAMDAVENARDLVVGSYELLSTRLSQRTNETMQMLTFVTVVLGSLAVAAGVLGMNFEAGIFKTGSRGFWIVVTAMVLFVASSVVIARRRGWWR